MEGVDMRSKLIVSIVAVMIVAMLAGCATQQPMGLKQKQGVVGGAALGGILGAIIGNNIGDGNNQALGAAMGTIHEEQRYAEPGNTEEDVPAGTPVAARRADALERIADNYLSDEAVSVKGGDRCTLHVHTDMNTLQADGDGAESELAAGGLVSAETSRRLACDCGVVHWLEDASGTALDIGRRTRSIPPAIRRALDRRDGGCRFPGCTARHYVDAHHIRHWADGGETRLDNLLLLCRYHHRLVHEGGYELELNTANEAVFTAPNGKAIPQGPDTRSRGNVFALTTGNRAERVEIGPRTLVPRWYGDKMDDGMAVDGLLRRECSLRPPPDRILRD
jgi:hypothetical protein